jgi:hypothetical protein
MRIFLDYLSVLFDCLLILSKILQSYSSIVFNSHLLWIFREYSSKILLGFFKLFKSKVLISKNE